MGSLLRVTRRGGAAARPWIRPARRRLNAADWAAVFGTRTTMPGQCSPVHGAALAASPLIPNLVYLGEPRLPACTAWARALFARGPRDAPLAPTTNKRAPESALDGERAAALAHALLGADAAHERLFLLDWEAHSLSGSERVRDAFSVARAAMAESTGFWGGGVRDPPLALALLLAQVWCRAQTKAELYAFVAALRKLRPAEVAGLPDCRDVARRAARVPPPDRDNVF